MTAKSRLTRRVLLAGMSALLFVSPRAFAQAVKKGGTLTFLMTNEPNVLMSFATTATTDLTVSAKTTEGLLEYDYDIKPRPSLSTEWSISPDGKTYTFKLRPDRKSTRLNSS